MVPLQEHPRGRQLPPAEFEAVRELFEICSLCLSMLLHWCARSDSILMNRDSCNRSSQILEELEPRDLLSLARTSKDLRTMLMTKSNELFWKKARANVSGLPECPTFLSEPAYASIVFSTYCYVRTLFLSARCGMWLLTP